MLLVILSQKDDARRAADRRISAAEKRAGVFDVIDTGGFDIDVMEAGAGELGYVLIVFEGAGDAANSEEHVLADIIKTAREIHH